MIPGFVEELKKKNIKVSFSKGRLRYIGPEEYIDEDMLKRLEENKAKLLKHFWPKECWNLMPINTEGELTPLSLLHAGPSNYPISEYLGKNRPFYGYFYIGSSGERIRYKNLEAFAAEYVKQLQNIVPEGPYYLGGLSFGGHLAFEMALQLQRQGQDVPLLILIDSGLPEEVVKGSSSIGRIIYLLVKRIYYKMYSYYWRILFGVFSFILAKIPVDKRNRYIRWTYINFIDAYKPTEKFKGKTLLFRATENESKKKYMGWEDLCGDIELVNFSGDHGAMYNKKSSVDLISAKIKDWLTNYERSIIN